jgi:putative Mn2+ efflux pump MntP
MNVGRLACRGLCLTRKLPMNFASTALLALAMSTDAFAAAVGKGSAPAPAALDVGLAVLGVDIVPVAVAIGTATFLMVTAGVMLGRVLGALAGKRAEIAGGVLLIVIGAVIVYEHIGQG